MIDGSMWQETDWVGGKESLAVKRMIHVGCHVKIIKFLTNSTSPLILSFSFLLSFLAFSHDHGETKQNPHVRNHWPSEQEIDRAKTHMLEIGMITQKKLRSNLLWLTNLHCYKHKVINNVIKFAIDKRLDVN
jgi:hypothetical protein